MSLTMVLKPRISEKAYGLSTSRNTYVFEVPMSSNKATIADAITAQFKVTVTNINVTTLKGKTTRRFRRGGRATLGTKPGVKKAYVTLRAGDTIAIFANEEDKAEKASAKREKK